MIAQGDRHRRQGRPGPLSRERPRECEQRGLGDSAILAADFDQPVGSDAPDRIPAERAVVDVEEDPDCIVSWDGRSIVRTDIHTHRTSGVGGREGARNCGVEPVVGASGEPVVRDAVSVVVPIRLCVGDSVVVEVQRHRVDDIRNRVPVRVGWTRRVLERHGLRRFGHGRAAENSTGDVRVEERGCPTVLGTVSTDVNVRVRTRRHVI